MKLSFLFPLVSACIALLLLLPAVVVAQQPPDDAKAVLDTELELLKKRQQIVEAQKAIAEAEKGIAEAQKAALAAQLPTTETKALEGKVTVSDNVAIGAHLQAHVALGRVADRIAQKIEAGRTAVLYNDRDVGALFHYAAVSANIGELLKRYGELVSPPDPKAFVAPIVVPFAVGALVKSVLDIVALTRSDVEVKGVSITIDEAALAAELARAKPGAIVYPPLLLPRTREQIASFALGRQLAELNAMRARAEQRLQEFAAKPESEKLKDPFRDRVAPLKALNDGTDKLVGVVTAVDPKTGLSDLAVLARAEILASRFEQPNTDLLFAKVVVAGGNNRTNRTLWSNRAESTGGCVVVFMIADASGTIKASGVERAMLEYATDKELAALPEITSKPVTR